MVPFDNFNDGNTEGQNVNITDSDNPSKKAAINDSSDLRVGKISTILSDQSTTTPLGANASFNDTGPFTEILQYNEISVAINTDQDGQNSGSNGLKVQWSQDGVNIDEEDTFTIIASQGGKHYTFGVSYKYVRVVINNGSVAQGFLRLQTIGSPFRTKASTHRVDDNIVDNDDAELVKSVITGHDPDGEYQNVPVCGPISVASSTTPLTADSTFSGPIHRARNWIGIIITMKSDVSSADDGLKVEWFMDEAGTFSLGEDVFTYNGNSLNKKRAFYVPVQGNYLKVTYTNGSTNQSNFTFHSYLCDKTVDSLTSSLVTPLNDNLLAKLVRSVIAGQDTNGVYRNVKTDENGNLQTALAPGANVIPSLGTNFQFNDMNATTGGIARGTTVTNDVWTQIYSLTGEAGLLFGIRVTLENLVAAGKEWWIRLEVDGIEVFGSGGLNMVDVGSITIYGWQSDATKLVQTWGGINMANNTFLWDAPNGLPLKYSTSIKVYVMHTGDSRSFLAGLVALTKE